MSGADCVIYDGEFRVTEKKGYEVVECVDGKPLVIAEFRRKEDAEEYAKAKQRSPLFLDMVEKVEAVLLCAARFAEGASQEMKDIDLFQCDFGGALAAIRKWREAKPDDIRNAAVFHTEQERKIR